MQEINQKYIDLYSEFHKDASRYPGDSIRNGVKDIQRLINETGSKSLLDYGCGKGNQYTVENIHKDWDIDSLELYDPAVPKYSELPKGRFDGIYSTDVMEHIPEEVLPSVFSYIFENADKFIFLAICTKEAHAILPNGENAHCTVKPVEWWTKMVQRHNKNRILTHMKCYGNSNGYVVFNK